MTPYAALQQRVLASPAEPMVTYLDFATGERMELSARSLDNAVAKTAGLLRDDLDADPGDSIAVHCRFHWQRAIWLGACAATGTVFAAGADPASCDIAVVDRDHLRFLGSAREDVVISLAPFGLPEPGGVPTGATDAAVAMRAHPDTFVPDALQDERAPLLVVGDQTLSAADVMAAAAECLASREVSGGRFAVMEGDEMADVLALAGPLISGGSVVLIAHPEQGDVQRALRDEGVSGGEG